MRFWLAFLTFIGLLFAQDVLAKDPGVIKSVYEAFVDVFLHKFDKEKISADIVHLLKGKSISKMF